MTRYLLVLALAAYDPTAKDICAGGDWVRVIPYTPKPSQ